MGNSSESLPNTTKTIHSDTSKHLKYTSCEMQGWRKSMEDTFIAQLQIHGSKNIIGIFGVFDGHGGSEVAKFVSNHFIQILSISQNFQLGKIAEALTDTFLQLDQQLKTKNGIKQCIKYKKQDSKSEDVSQKDLKSGTTALVVVITDNKIICANAGDSRAALYTGKKVIPLSCDHKPQNSIEKERIKMSGVRIIEGRVNGLNLTRSIGDLDHKNVPNLAYNQQPIICIPEIIEVQRTEDDKIILIGCDGIWQKYGQDFTVLTTDFYQKIKTQQHPQQILEEFFQKNIEDNRAGPYGKDNMTAIIIQFMGSQIKNIIQNYL